jgi:outer membrane protein TolC
VTLETVGLEVQIAVREVETSQRELVSKQQVVQARADQLDYLTKRWERLPNEDVTSSLMLENILSAQDRLTQAEYEYLQAQISYNLSHINLRKATGTLYQYETVNTR